MGKNILRVKNFTAGKIIKGAGTKNSGFKKKGKKVVKNLWD